MTDWNAFFTLCFIHRTPLLRTISPRVFNVWEILSCTPPGRYMIARKCTQESISCITCIGSRQVHFEYNAVGVFHSCNQRLARNALGLQGQITLTILGLAGAGGNNVLFLPAPTIQQSQRHHSSPSKPITREARRAPDFRVLPASPQVFLSGR